MGAMNRRLASVTNNNINTGFLEFLSNSSVSINVDDKHV